MTIYKLLLRLYPRTWRVRYEEEVLVVLASHPFSVFEGIDVIRGALDAHLHPSLGTTSLSLSERMRQMLLAMRCSLLTIFCASVGFFLAGGAFQKMTESGALAEVARANSQVGLSFHLVVIGAFSALLAALAGGLPVAIAVIRSSFVHKRLGPLLLLTAPILAGAVFFGTGIALFALLHPGNHPEPGWTVVLSRSVFFGMFIATAATSASAFCFAVIRSELPEKLLRFALFPSLLVTFSMALMCAATIAWGLGLRDGAPQLFAANDGLVGASTTGTWLGIIIAMTLATGLSVLSLMRGLSARSVLRNAAAEYLP